MKIGTGGEDPPITARWIGGNRCRHRPRVTPSTAGHQGAERKPAGLPRRNGRPRISSADAMSPVRTNGDTRQPPALAARSSTAPEPPPAPAPGTWFALPRPWRRRAPSLPPERSPTRPGPERRSRFPGQGKGKGKRLSWAGPGRGHAAGTHAARPFSDRELPTNSALVGQMVSCGDDAVVKQGPTPTDTRNQPLSVLASGQARQVAWRCCTRRCYCIFINLGPLFH